MTKIRILDNLTIQKIAAGEVIERPASIVKELVENSLDAKSKNIVIEINEGGKSLIRITDDGDGIEEEDLSIAFERHTTSKLNTIDDLYSIMTLGFRGEALSSIASVAKVEVLTKTNSSSAGLHAFIEEGTVKSIEKVGTPKGTTMIVRDLFYNLPVRKKFLKTDLSEGNKISDIVNKLALGNYNTSFKYIKDNKVILKTSSNGDMKENIYTILGKDISKGLIPISFNSAEMSISGFISNNNLYRSNRNHQYIYINGRYIVNYSISSAIEHHYKSLIPLNRYPVFILYIEMNPSDMDVNIHPTKQEVKFVYHNDIHGIISNVIKNHLFPSINVPRLEISKKEVKQKDDDIPLLFDLKEDDMSKGIIVKDYTNTNLDANTKPYNEYSSKTYEVDILKDMSFKDYVIDPLDEIVDFKDETLDNKDEKSIDIIPDINPIGVVFGTYILGESEKKDKLFFIDQHAAHERVLYERFKKEFEEEKVHMQQLLVPEILELTNNEISDVLKNQELFIKLGFDLEEFGSNSILIRGVPFIFGVPNIKSLFLDLLDNLTNDIKSSYDTRADKLMKLACSKAIKSGDTIKNIEIKSLLNDLVKCDNPYSCPHGRPTIIEITKRDIEKQFLRIM